MQRRLLSVVILLAAAWPTIANEEKDQPKSPVYKTPEEVFTAFLVAQSKGDHKPFVGLLTPDAVKALAADKASNLRDRVATYAMPENKGRLEDQKKREKPLFEVAAKHGLTEKVLLSIQYNNRDASPERENKVLRKLLAAIKDPKDFIVEYLPVEDKVQGIVHDGKMEGAPKLADVKMDGDKATGAAVLARFGQERKFPVEFAKIDGTWKINPEPKKIVK
jgi:hypothetical protein